jgi:hypothetical protein
VNLCSPTGTSLECSSTPRPSGLPAGFVWRDKLSERCQQKYGGRAGRVISTAAHEFVGETWLWSTWWWQVEQTPTTAAGSKPRRASVFRNHPASLMSMPHHPVHTSNSHHIPRPPGTDFKVGWTEVLNRWALSYTTPSGLIAGAKSSRLSRCHTAIRLEPCCSGCSSWWCFFCQR